MSPRPVIQFRYRLPKGTPVVRIFARSVAEAVRALRAVYRPATEYDFRRFASRAGAAVDAEDGPIALGETVTMAQARAAYPSRSADPPKP